MNFPNRAISWLATMGGLYVLAGCASVSVPVLDVAKGTFAQWRSAAAVVEIPDVPNPAYRFLRVEVQGRPPALLALGYLDPGPLGEVEVWYSSQREVIRTSAGRIVGTVGLEVDWRAVRYRNSPPLWNTEMPAEFEFERLRDVMPGYRFDIRERLVLSRVGAAPPGTLPKRLPHAVAWYVERVLSPQPLGLPEAVYAVARSGGKSTVLYSRQCLSEDFCLHLQPWPVPVIDP